MQVATPPAGTGHAVHVGPQNAGSVCAGHLSAQAWNPALHVKLHLAAAHAAVPFVTAGQAVMQLPQWLVLVFGSTHSAPQRSGEAGVQPFVHWKLGPFGEHCGAAAPHVALHAPQLVAFDRSVSQPSTAFALQSA